MKPFYLMVAFLVSVSTACKSSKSTYTATELTALSTLVNNKQFRIESNHAYPQVTNAMQQVLNSGLMQAGNTAGNISLIGNANFLKISGDSITSHLPYFGERQMQVAYGGGDSAIEFNGLVKNYKAIQNKDHSYTITLEATSNSESFDVTIRLTPSLNSNITLNGTSRFPIRYSGSVAPINNP